MSGERSRSVGARVAGALAAAALLLAGDVRAFQQADVAEPEVEWKDPAQQDELLVEALTKLRMWDLETAEDILYELCPEVTETAPEGTSLVDLACSARANKVGEAKGAKDTAEWAAGYWWGGERARSTRRAAVARAFFAVALDRNPKDSPSWTGIGRLDRDAGDLESSNKALRKAMQLDSKNLDAPYWLAVNRLEQNDLTEAESLLQRIVAKDKKIGRAWYRLGMIRQKQGRHPEAIGLFEKAKANEMDAKVVAERIEESRKVLAEKAR